MTPTELKARVLQEIGVLATGEDPDFADAEVVGQKYASLHEMLTTEGLVTWLVEDDVPSFAEQAIVWMVAHQCCGSFGVPASKVVDLQQKGAWNLPPAQSGPSLGERQLRRQLAKGFVYSPVETEYF